MFPVFWSGRSVETTADQILQGQRFTTTEIASEVTKLEAEQLPARASVRRSLAILKLRLAEDALAQGDRLMLDRRFADLKRSMIELFEIDPSDSFFWTIYYWHQVTTEGFTPAQLKFLEMSYALGPNEGWIAIRRNRLALQVMSQLPDATVKRVVDEFAAMVASGLMVDAAAILSSVGAPARAKLAEGLTAVSLPDRERFSRYLYDTGTELAIPGVNLPEKHFY